MIIPNLQVCGRHAHSIINNREAMIIPNLQVCGKPLQFVCPSSVSICEPFLGLIAAVIIAFLLHIRKWSTSIPTENTKNNTAAIKLNPTCVKNGGIIEFSFPYNNYSIFKALAMLSPKHLPCNILLGRNNAQKSNQI